MHKFIKLISALITATVLSVSHADASTVLTETSVGAMVDAIQEAARNADADGVVAHFADGAQITLDMPQELGGKMELSVNQYRGLMKMSWSVVTGYAYHVKEKTITVKDGGMTATVNSVVVETMDVNGESTTQHTNETLEIKLQDGEPKITRAYATLAE